MYGSRGPGNGLEFQAIDWLLASDEPGIRMQARRDLLGEHGTGWSATSASQMLTLNALRVLKTCS